MKRWAWSGLGVQRYLMPINCKTVSKRADPKFNWVRMSFQMDPPVLNRGPNLSEPPWPGSTTYFWAYTKTKTNLLVLLITKGGQYISYLKPTNLEL